MSARTITDLAEMLARHWRTIRRLRANAHADQQSLRYARRSLEREREELGLARSQFAALEAIHVQWRQRAEAAEARLAEVERAAPAPAPTPDDGWIPWAGGDCPVPVGTCGRIRKRNGSVILDRDMGIGWCWRHQNTPGDIIAYRVEAAR